VQTVEALPEVPTDAMPFLTVWVTYDRLLGSCFNVMRECEPVVAALNRLINGRYEKIKDKKLTHHLYTDIEETSE
jgi:hypothetical protein